MEQHLPLRVCPLVARMPNLSYIFDNWEPTLVGATVFDLVCLLTYPLRPSPTRLQVVNDILIFRATPRMTHEAYARPMLVNYTKRITRVWLPETLSTCPFDFGS